MTPRILVAIYGDHQHAVVSELLDFGIRVPTDAMDALAAIASINETGVLT